MLLRHGEILIFPPFLFLKIICQMVNITIIIWMILRYEVKMEKIPANPSLLVHEVTHAWQYQYAGIIFSAIALECQALKFAYNPYNYSLSEKMNLDNKFKIIKDKRKTTRCVVHGCYAIQSRSVGFYSGRLLLSIF